MEINNISFNGLNQGDAHTCTGTVQGEHIVFRCNLCPGYERIINKRTGRIASNSDQNKLYQHIRHNGIYAASKEEIFHTMNNYN